MDLGFFETIDGMLYSTATCFVWLEGGDAMANELETFLNSNYVAIQNWVASGGHLFLNSAPNEEMVWIIFWNVSLFYAWYTITAAPGDPGHPIFDGPFTPVGASWSGSSFGHAVVEGDADPVIIDAFDDSRVVLAEKHWGAGIAMFVA